MLGVLLGSGYLFFQGNGVIIPPREFQNDTNLEIGLWTPDAKVEQTFIASQDNLVQIGFWLDSYHPWDNPYLDCRLFELATEENPFELSYDTIRQIRHEVRYKRLNGWLLSPHMYNSFSFLAIPDSKGKRYLLSIQAPEIKKGGTSILLASPIDRYMYYGNLFVNGEKQEGDLAFRVGYARSRSALIQKIFQRIALRKPGIFSYPALYYILAVGYIGLLMGLGYNLFTISANGGNAKK
jgi:hypothetical protein